jgi:hypothetical protein
VGGEERREGRGRKVRKCRVGGLRKAGLIACRRYLSSEVIIFWEMHCSAVQYSAVQYSAVQYSTVQCSAIQCSAVQYSARGT